MVEAIVVGIPAIIAAVSSLKNGFEQKRVKTELARTNGHLEKLAKRRTQRAHAGWPLKKPEATARGPRNTRTNFSRARKATKIRG